MTVGMGLRTAAQAGVFLVIARVLGVQAYGAYAAVLAVAGTLGTFSGFGVPMLMLRDVARDPASFPVAWGRTLAAIGVSIPTLAGIYGVLAWAILPTGLSWFAVGLIGFAELAFGPLALAGVNAYQGHERIGRAGRLVLVPILVRLLAALALLPLALYIPASMRLVAWSTLYAVAALFAAVYAVWLVYRDFGPPIRPEARELRASLGEGVTFAFGGAALKLYMDIDKTMLARLSTLEAAGAYSAAYRVVDMALLPVNALLAATLPRFFRAGESDVGASLRYGWRILPLPLLYTVSIAAALYVGAQWLPLLLGASYQLAVNALQWLCWLPLIGLARLLLQLLLTSADRQREVAAVLGLGAALNIVLNLGLIPLWSWRGAVLSTYAAEVVMALAFSRLAWRYGRSS